MKKRNMEPCYKILWRIEKQLAALMPAGPRRTREEGSRKSHKQNKMKKLLSVITLACLIVGCQNFNTATFRSENLVADTARGAVHAWNQYAAIALPQASVSEAAKITSAQTQIYDASRKLGATLRVVDGLRLAYLTNSASTNLTALQAALEAATSQSGAIVQLVQTFLGSSPTPTK